MKNKVLTARDMIYSLPQRLKKEKVQDNALHRFHLKLDGVNGGNFTVTLKNKEVVILDGLVDEPTCEIKASAKAFEDLQQGKGNPAMLFMMGKIKVSNLNEVLKFVEYFDRII
ncbi:MAG: SCP2 sterol-binding domain-containing protein [Bacteroidetes bacterium]|nr:SCP2 sterol-binding domain-containing protein [Bacteroidota bacterium]